MHLLLQCAFSPIVPGPEKQRPDPNTFIKYIKLQPTIQRFGKYLLLLSMLQTVVQLKTFGETVFVSGFFDE